MAKARFAAFVGERDAHLDDGFLQTNCGSDRRILGSESFSRSLLHTPPSIAQPSLDEITAHTCAACEVGEEALASASRERRYAEVRAQIAWHAMRSGVATLAQVARRYNRNEPVLSRAVSRYCRSRRC